MRDADGNATITAWSGWTHEGERLFEVVEHVETADDEELAWKLDALEKLFRAAVDAGTRVDWW